MIKYQPYPNSTKIDAFEQRICLCHKPSNKLLVALLLFWLSNLITPKRTYQIMWDFSFESKNLTGI